MCFAVAYLHCGVGNYTYTSNNLGQHFKHDVVSQETFNMHTIILYGKIL